MEPFQRKAGRISGKELAFIKAELRKHPKGTRIDRRGNVVGFGNTYWGKDRAGMEAAAEARKAASDARMAIARAKAQRVKAQALAALCIE